MKLIELDKEKVAIYNVGKYGDCYYGDFSGTKSGHKINYKGRPVGRLIRGQVGRRDIFRKRHGNGYAGSVAGRVYQDRYRYFVDASIMHPNGDASRAKFAAAMAAWKALDLSEKQDYNHRAAQRGGLTGSNLYVKKYMKGEI